MATNFRVQKKNKSRKLLSLQLFGDFDGTSADQLFNFLNAKIRKVDRVTIDTNGLRHVNDFGINVFKPHIARLSMARLAILFTGKFSSQFSNE